MTAICTTRWVASMWWSDVWIDARLSQFSRRAVSTRYSLNQEWQEHSGGDAHVALTPNMIVTLITLWESAYIVGTSFRFRRPIRG